MADLVDLDVVNNPPAKTSTATIYTRLNTSSGSTASFSSTVTTAYTVGGVAGAQLQTPDSNWGKLRKYDFNGDRLDDLSLTTITGTSPNYSLNTYELLSTGTAFTASLIASAPGSTYTPVFYTQWNDDACTDYVSSTTLYVSGCNGTVPTTSSIGTVLGAMDWDGDGRTDLLVAAGSYLGVYLSTGAGVSALVKTSVPYVSTCQYVSLDANGDGLDDIGCWSQTGSSPLSYYLHNGPPPDLANAFTDGYGNSVKPTYVSITQGGNYYAWTTQVFPYANYNASYYEVYAATFSDPSSASGGTYSQDYFYAGAAVNLQGRGFAGFGSMETYDSRSGIWATNNYNLVFPWTGMVAFSIADQNNLASQATNTVSYSQKYACGGHAE